MGMTLRNQTTNKLNHRGLLTLAMAALLALALALPAGASLWEDGDKNHDPVVINSKTISTLAEKLKPAVVNIDTEATISVGGGQGGGAQQFGPNVPKDFREFFERFFGQQMPEQKRRRIGTGSGFIINEEGYIVTNNHVIEKADKIVVRLLDKRQFPAKVIGTDPKTDVALLKIEADDLPYVPLGDSNTLQVGDWVLAIGNPFGLSHTVTSGIVSAKGRVIGAGPYDDFIQTDAAINFGNSGGPLFNFYGEVVGMNTAIIAQGQGIGFAVPVNLVKQIVTQLKEKGKVVRAELGVLIQPITKEIKDSFGLEDAKGALISQVLPDSAAEKAGLKRGDVIVEFNGQKIDEFNDLPRMVAIQPVGSKAKVTVVRDGKTKTIKVTLGQRKDRDLSQFKGGGKDESETGDLPKFGLKVQT